MLFFVPGIMGTDAGLVGHIYLLEQLQRINSLLTIFFIQVTYRPH